MSNNHCKTGLEIAVVGMAGRFPGACNIDQFWFNLKNGVESVTFYSNEELLDAGIATGLLEDPNYVKSGGGLLADKEYFDAHFFGYSPVEAELMDPQVRIFHECVWHALEDAGYDPFSYDELIGLYAGASFNIFWESLVMFSGRIDTLGGFATMLLLDRDSLCTRISYHLNLKGPSVVVKTACSTSLVAVHMACQAILNGECDMALAGGVTAIQLTKSGYLYREGMIASPDGHCRAFDAQAKGIIAGDGVGVVILKRLEEAITHRDNIYAVIKGTAINNDGIRKAGYTAPSIEGQSQVIAEALQLANVEPETVTYVETHGTGTTMGDPIEMESLKLAFNTDKKQYCRIGSVKTNIGHLDSAAGVTSLIKTVLALKHKLIPPSLNFKNPNPKFDFENSPFYVNTELSEWKCDGHPLRAGVSSFGIGGTNAHAVLEEITGIDPSSGSRTWKLLILSAKTQAALERTTANLLEFLKNNPGINLADVAYTLQVGRKSFPYRRMALGPDVAGVIETLSSVGLGNLQSAYIKEERLYIIFMFSGLGSQYVNMGLSLYKNEPLFQEEIDRCFDILEPLMGYDMKEILYPEIKAAKEKEKRLANSDKMNQFVIAQAVVFIFEYALAKLLMKWGIKPHAMIGYSFGEYTASCMSGVFSLEDALKMIVVRGQLIGQMPPGSMLSVPLPMDELKPLLSNKLSIAIDNGSSCIVAGPDMAINEFEEQLKKKKYICLKLPNSYALHSKMMKPILEKFEKHVERIELNIPQIPYISNLTGKWITAQEVTKPSYWVNHLQETVRFAEGIEELKKKTNPIFIEIGPGRDLCVLVSRHKDKEANPGLRTVNLIPPLQQDIPHDRYMLSKIGQLWLYGVNIDWKEFYIREKRNRISLPVYPFARQRYWIDIDPFQQATMGNTLSPQKNGIEDWAYTLQWIRSELSVETGETDNLQNKDQWLLFIDDSSLGGQFVQRLKNHDFHVVVVKPGTTLAKPGENEYIVNPADRNHYDRLFKELVQAGNIPTNILHLWGLSGNQIRKTNKTCAPILQNLDQSQDMGLYSLLNIAQAIADNGIYNEIQLGVITDNMQYVTGEEDLAPEKATILGAVKIIPIEYPNIFCRSIDIENPGLNKRKIGFIIHSLVREFSTGFADHQVIAYRGTTRWKEIYEPASLNRYPKSPRLKEKGIYLITGGLGGMGFTLAEHLARTLNARLSLVDILDFPDLEGQEEWLTSENRKKNIHMKMEKIKELEKMGAEIKVYDADVSDYQRMEVVISDVKQRFGKIDGVIHTAGLIDHSGVIQRRTREMTKHILAPKVKGTLVLDELLKNHKLDFMVSFSSIGNVLYKIKFGEAASNAGNEFLDAFAYYKRKTCTFALTIDWNYWLEEGMAARVAAKKNDSGDKSRSTLAYEELLSISPSEGIEIFKRMLNSDLCRVIVSPRDLSSMIRYINAIVDKKSETSDLSRTTGTIERFYERPGLSTSYAAPNSQTERAIAVLWQKFFGITKIGIYDDFFELGGDSLTAATMTLQIQQALRVRVPLVEVFNRPTIQKLAEYIRVKGREEFQEVHEDLVLLKEGSAKASNFYFVHTGSGEVESYNELCNHLTCDLNFWGIRANRIRNYMPENIEAEEIAKNYIEKIRTLQPKGPYNIAGWCTGGVLSFEIARQLKEMNEEVSFLGLLDTSVAQVDSGYYASGFTFKSEFEIIDGFFPEDEVIKKRLNNLSRFDQFWSTVVDYIEEIQFDVEKIKPMLPSGMAGVMPNFDQLTSRELIFHMNMIRTTLRTETIYFPKSKNRVKPHLFIASQSAPRYLRGKLKWSDFCDVPVKINEVAGDHYSILKKPDVMQLAKIFEKEIQEALDPQPKKMNKMFHFLI
jgi:acyl transferase domain-containing protein/thioesterase domain-containing protein/acyl carrier protein